MDAEFLFSAFVFNKAGGRQKLYRTFPGEDRGKLGFACQLSSRKYSIFDNMQKQQRSRGGSLRLFSNRTCILQDIFAIIRFRRLISQPAEI